MFETTQRNRAIVRKHQEGKAKHSKFWTNSRLRMDNDLIGGDGRFETAKHVSFAPRSARSHVNGQQS